MATTFLNYERGLWQVGLMVRALRSVQEISYIDQEGGKHNIGFKIDARASFSEIATPVLDAISDLQDSMNPDGSLPETVAQYGYEPYTKVALFLAMYGPLSEGKHMTFEDFCRDVR